MKFKEKLFFSAIEESFSLIRKNKVYFVILFFMQLILIITISAIFTNYAIQIGKNMQDIIEPLQGFASTMGEDAATTMLENSEVITSAYSMFTKNIAFLILFSFLAYFFIGGLNWDFSNLIVNKKDIPFSRYLLMFAKSVLLFSFIAISFSAFFLKLLVYVGNGNLAKAIGIFLVLGVSYFSFISFSLIHKFKTFKDLLKNTIQIGYKNPHTLFFSYLFMLLMIILFAGVVYLLLYSPMPALFFSLVFFILIMNWGKIYFMTTVNKIIEKK